MENKEFNKVNDFELKIAILVDKAYDNLSEADFQKLMLRVRRLIERNISLDEQ